MKLLEAEIKAGDQVICIEPEGADSYFDLEPNSIHTVDVAEGDGLVLKGKNQRFSKARFILKTDNTVEESSDSTSKIPKELDDSVDIFDDMVHNFKILCSEWELYLDKIRQIRGLVPRNTDQGMYKAMADMRGNMQQIDHLSRTVRDINGLVSVKETINDQLEEMMKMYEYQKDVCIPDMITSKMERKIIKKSIFKQGDK